MEINPFYVTNNIPEEYFCDRLAESEKLLKSIFNQENVVLYAQRRIGKTGLINHCFNDSRVKQEFYAISIDILHTNGFDKAFLPNYIDNIPASMYADIYSSIKVSSKIIKFRA